MKNRRKKRKTIAPKRALRSKLPERVRVILNRTYTAREAIDRLIAG